MHTLLKARPWVFFSLFVVPLLLHLTVWQFSIRSLARETEFALLFPHLSVTQCLLIKGASLGLFGGLISILMALIVFKLFPEWTWQSKYGGAYAIFWLFPFCAGSLFGFAMSSAAPGATMLRTALEMLSAGLYGFSFAGILGGSLGIAIFILLQIGLSDSGERE